MKPGDTLFEEARDRLEEAKVSDLNSLVEDLDNFMTPAGTVYFWVKDTPGRYEFKVISPRNNSGKVQISEFLGLQASGNEMAVIDRVLLDRPRWTAIRGEEQRAFNARLKAHDLNASAWKIGENPVDRLLGEELCVLAWAVEHMEMEKIPVAVRNWLDFRPEERWWLFGMTAICTGGINDGDKGRRLALRHALGDVAQSDLLMPQPRRLIGGSHDERPNLDLFEHG